MAYTKSHPAPEKSLPRNSHTLSNLSFQPTAGPSTSSQSNLKGYSKITAGKLIGDSEEEFYMKVLEVSTRDFPGGPAVKTAHSLHSRRPQLKDLACCN